MDSFLRIILNISLFGLITILNFQAIANPEFIRHQYNTCMACHVSPAGGGILSTYGRGLSSEVISHWGTDKEAGFLETSLDDGKSDEDKLNQWYLFGGDLRAVQVHKEDEIVRQGRSIPMQADISLALQKNQFTIVINVGELEPENHNWHPYASQYYLMLRPTDEITLRGGKFIPQYGLHLSDHILFIRSYLGFGMNSERDTMEAQYNGENWTSSLTNSQQLDADKNLVENASSMQIQYYFFDSSKFAFNYWNGQSKSSSRDLSGIWGILTFSKNIYWMTEWDFQKSKTTLSSRNSAVHYNKFAYAITKGFDLFLHEEFMQTNVKDSTTVTNRRGLGFQFFPRPHFDISAVWTKELTNPNLQADYAWLLLHYYL